jgi:murein DD-endopeptidase MepM/ murein hydrolase activator NlpD
MKTILLITASLIALSACQQNRPAPIELRGNRSYTDRGVQSNAALKPYSDRSLSEENGWQDSGMVAGEETYTVPASIGEVSSAELPPVDGDNSGYAEPVMDAVQPAPIIGESTTSTYDPFASEPPATEFSADDAYSGAATPAPKPAPITQPLPDVEEDHSLEKLNEYLKGDDTSTIDAERPYSERKDKLYDEFSRAERDYAAKNPVENPVIATRAMDDDYINESFSEQSFVSPLRGNVVRPYNDSTKAIGIAARMGEPIRAAADGVVAHAGDDIASLGNMVLVRHSNGYVSTYAHMGDIVVSKGDNVVKGELIGFVGKSGNVEQPQLGFGLRRNNRPLDPTDILKQ